MDNNYEIGDDKMSFLDLKFFVLFMWALVMIACLFIILVIAPISKFLIIPYNPFSYLQASIIQATLAVFIVGLLILILNKFKKIYLFKKLEGKN